MVLKAWLSAVTLILGLAAAAANAETFVVVESSAPDVKVGTELGDGAAITVADQGRVVLVGSSGQMVTLTGPFQGVPKAEASGATQSRVFTTIASLVAKSGTTVGVSRAAAPQWRADAVKTAEDVFAIDAGEGGDTCLYDLSKARVTRNPSGGSGDTTIMAMEGSATATVAWAPGAAYAPWPRGVPLADDASYVMEQAGQSVAAIATIHLLEAAPTMTGVERVAQIAERGCDAQARLLLAIVAKASK